MAGATARRVNPSCALPDSPRRATAIPATMIIVAMNSPAGVLIARVYRRPSPGAQPCRYFPAASDPTSFHTSSAPEWPAATMIPVAPRPASTATA